MFQISVHGGERRPEVQDVDEFVEVVSSWMREIDGGGLGREGLKAFSRSADIGGQPIWLIQDHTDATKADVERLARMIHPYVGTYTVIIASSDARNDQLRGETVAPYDPWVWERGEL